MKILNKKIVKIILIIIVGVSIFLYALGWGIMKYQQWKGEKEVEKLAQAMKDSEEEQMKLAMADTVGGQTPQETLEMFISAVEAGDYELASKYFVIPRQESQLKFLKQLDNEALIWFLDKMLKPAKLEYIDDKHATVVSISSESDIYYSHIHFWKYPNDIWKIDRITPEEF